jgi:hypothetical protein
MRLYRAVSLVGEGFAGLKADLRANGRERVT